VSVLGYFRSRYAASAWRCFEWCCGFPELAWLEDDFFDFFFEWLFEELFDFFVLLGAAPPVSGAIVGELLVWA
jgi:hypothetical protein